MIKATQFIEFEEGTELPYAGKILALLKDENGYTHMEVIEMFCGKYCVNDEGLDLLAFALMEDNIEDKIIKA